MIKGHDLKVERIISILVQESYSQVGSIRISNQDDIPDHNVWIGMTTEKNERELLDHLQSDSFYREIIKNQPAYVFEIKDKSKALYEQGIRYGMIVPLLNQNVLLGTVFLGSPFAYTNDVADFIQKKVHTFAEYYVESMLSNSNESEAGKKGNEPLQIRLKRYEQSAKALFEQNPDVMWWMDNNGTIISVNSRIEDISGFQKKHFVNQSFDRFFTNKDLETAIGCFVSAKKGKSQNFEVTFIHNEGHHVELNLTFVPVTVDYKIVGVYGIAKDITEKKKYELALKESNEFITNILDSITDAFLAVDSNWRITYWNKETELLTERNREEILGADLWDVLSHWVDTSTFPKLHKALHEQVTVQYESYDQANDKWYWVHAYPKTNGLSIYINDITGRKKAEQQVAYMTYYDTLTGLPNQTLFKERLNSTLLRAKASHDSFAVMVIDLDRFKMINDLLGYDRGDRILISVSKRLASCLREDDTICRYEGNIFTVLLLKVNRVKMECIAERIINECQKPLEIDHQEIVVTPSIGIGFYPDDGNDTAQLIANAETAMRRAKEKGRNNYQLYNGEMNNSSSLNMMKDLQKSLDRNELKVVYQPQLDIRTGRIVGAEALLRWNHPELGMIQPGDFIPLAEESGFIIPIGEWVLKTACSQNKVWQDAGYGPIVISVNLSPRQFTERNIVEVVRNVLEETGLNAKYLDLEITESMTMDVSRTLKTLNDLKQIGVHISMDDFGKGYSSLTYLKLFPLNRLKIDKSFIRDCTTDTSDATIVKTIISLAHHLNLTVIAEGVETKEDLIYLQQHLCNEAQGYLFSKPIPAEEFVQKYSGIQDVVKKLGLNSDLTERMWIEEQLRIARQDLQDTVRQQQGMTFKFKEQDGRFIHTLCDGELLHRLGMLPEHVVGKELTEFLPEDIAKEKTEFYRRAWQGEPDVTYEGYLNFTYYLASLRPVMRGGRIVEVIGSCIDITKRKLAEEALRKADAKYQLIAENMSDLIAVIDNEGILRYASPSHQMVLGYPPEAYEGKSGFGIHPEDLAYVSEKLDEIIQTKNPKQVEFRFEHREGRWVTFEAKGTPVYSGNDELVYVIIVARDITERKKTEEYILKSEKLALAGELAAGIAHEIRNPITSIKGFVQLLKNNPDKLEYFDIMFSEFRSLECKINEFLMLAKPQAVLYEPIDMRDLLHDVVLLLESQAILKNITISINSEPLFSNIMGDKSQLKQVFLNFLKNAIESMTNGGEVQVQLKRQDSGVLLRIIDQGCGIDKERLSRIGEPFYSTKEKGTGLGLTISCKIIKEHKGEITFTSEVDKGTVVEVCFPVLN